MTCPSSIWDTKSIVEDRKRYDNNWAAIRTTCGSARGRAFWTSSRRRAFRAATGRGTAGGPHRRRARASLLPTAQTGMRLLRGEEDRHRLQECRHAAPLHYGAGSDKPEAPHWHLRPAPAHPCGSHQAGATDCVDAIYPRPRPGHGLARVGAAKDVAIGAPLTGDDLAGRYREGPVARLQSIAPHPPHDGDGFSQDQSN